MSHEILFEPCWGTHFMFPPPIMAPALHTLTAKAEAYPRSRIIMPSSPARLAALSFRCRHCVHRSLRNPRQPGRLTSRQTNSHSVSPSPYFCSDEKLPPAFTRGGGGMKLPELLLLLLLVLNKAAAESGSPSLEAEEVTLIHLSQVGSIVDILAPVAGLGE